jgi:hypothetical protein
MYNSSTQCRFKLQSAYKNWVHEILNGVWNKQLWNGFQVAFMFNHVPGSFERKCEVMEDEIDRVYRTLVPRVERFPRSPAGSKRLPILIAFPDYAQHWIKSADLLGRQYWGRRRLQGRTGNAYVPAHFLHKLILDYWLQQLSKTA